MPNIFAFSMIAFWPIVAIFLYRRLDIGTASFWIIVGGYMFLPEKTSFDLPLLPPIGKDEISALSALLGCLVIKKIPFPFFGITRVQKVLIAMLLIIPFINVYFNMEPMFNGSRWMPGLRPYDALHQVIAQYLDLIPFLVGLVVIKTSEDLKKLMDLLVIAGLIYAPLVLFEVRFSPQLHSWFYGFFPHEFRQQIRYDGFRAAVFMGHGLLVAAFYTVCCAVAFAKWRFADEKLKLKALLIFLFLVSVLILNKSVGPVLLTLLVVAVLYTNSLFVYKKTILAVLALFLVYPLLSISGIIPYDEIISYLYTIDTNRAQSLETRFVNEEVLVQHANEKFFIGWGGWARNRFFDSLSDGYWLIIFGTYGAVYFFSYFLLFVQPIFTNSLSVNTKLNNKIVWALGIVLLSVLINQIPNSSLAHSWLWFISGAIAGYFTHSHCRNTSTQIGLK